MRVWECTKSLEFRTRRRNWRRVSEMIAFSRRNGYYVIISTWSDDDLDFLQEHIYLPRHHLPRIQCQYHSITYYSLYLVRTLRGLHHVCVTKEDSIPAIIVFEIWSKYAQDSMSHRDFLSMRKISFSLQEKPLYTILDVARPRKNKDCICDDGLKTLTSTSMSFIWDATIRNLDWNRRILSGMVPILDALTGWFPIFHPTFQAFHPCSIEEPISMRPPFFLHLRRSIRSIHHDEIKKL